MISNILCIGNKIELAKIPTSENIEYPSTDKKIYVSYILDIIDEDKLKIGIPAEQGKSIPLKTNARFDACFYTKNDLYQGRVVVKDRYKEEQNFILVVEVTSNLQKYQRRRYYRLGCEIDIHYRKIEDEVFNEGTALDISGGGIRFVSDEKLQQNQKISMVLEIVYEDQKKTYRLLGKVIMSSQVKNDSGLFEHRIEFTDMQGSVRESLIKYIFEEEKRRKNRESSL